MASWVRELLVGFLVGTTISLLFGYWLWYLKGLIELQKEDNDDLHLLVSISRERCDRMQQQIAFLGDVIKFVDAESKRRAEEMDGRYIRRTPLIEEESIDKKRLD